MPDPVSADIKSDSEPWSVLENLILAQAIYKCGDTNWVAIARTIKGHPQVHRSSNFFSQKLLENLEAETRSKQSRGNESGASSAQDLPSVVKLAGQLYNQRIVEIKALIRKDEERFRALVAELDEIRQGKWDRQLAEELKRNPPESDAEAIPGENGSFSSSSDTSHQQPPSDHVPADSVSALPSLTTPPPALLPESSEQASASDTSNLETQQSTATSTTPAASDEKTSAMLPKDLGDVEMEDVAAIEPSLEMEEGSNNASALTTGDDVEMEDVSSKDLAASTAPSATLAQQNNEDKKAVEGLKSGTGSPASASDLSPPDAIEEDEDTSAENGTGASVTAVNEDVEAEEEEEEEEEDKAEEEEQEEEDGEDDTTAIKVEADDRIGSDNEHTSQRRSRATSSHAEASLEPEDSSKEEAEEVEPKEETDDAATHAGAEDGATSADDEETMSTIRLTKRPKKIKTTVPIKRKRRSGRGGANGDNEDGYNSSDSEAMDSPSTAMSDMRTQMDDKKWKKILTMIWDEIANHKYGAVFMQPIKEQDAPGYLHMIKRPMDLKSIKDRIRDGQITNADEFHRDLLLMFLNAVMYNGEETEVYEMALKMMNEVEHIMKNFKSSQSFGPPTSTLVAGAGGSGNNSNSTTPTTRTAGSELGQPAIRKRKSSGLEMAPVE
ncbi:hypothetical protein BGZ99_004108 [Dissophora globulifera]|uniref:Bromo domain-containing protein n=1 Tax=Dissophora globulifera TaxID=979702 RepID=A0A9P6RIJ7_9FUNG|nr:hypothetical protein BGZ99_004108 [Dissophora globulifera]